MPHGCDSLGGQLGLLSIEETLQRALRTLDGLHLRDSPTKDNKRRLSWSEDR